MSLVLTGACTLFTMQVSDRLVTEIRPADRATRPFDALSNKSIIFRALNAIVSMGYVGSAYVDRKPTDEWIAEQLWGEPLTDRTPDGRMIHGEGPTGSIKGLHSSQRRPAAP
jgi:hypothetical protein